MNGAFSDTPEWNHQVIVRHPDSSETNLGWSGALRGSGVMDEAVRLAVVEYGIRRQREKDFRAMIDKVKERAIAATAPGEG